MADVKGFNKRKRGSKKNGKLRCNTIGNDSSEARASPASRSMSLGSRRTATERNLRQSTLMARDDGPWMDRTIAGKLNP